MHLNEKIVLIIVLYQCLTICNSQIVKPKKRKPGYPGANDCSISWATESDAPIINHENTGMLQKTGSVKIKLNSDFKLSCENGNFITPEALQTTKEIIVKCKEGNTLEYQKQPYRYEEFKCNYHQQMRPPKQTRKERLQDLRGQSAKKFYASVVPKLNFYYDLLSQPSRTLHIFMKKFEIPFKPILVSLRKGEHLRSMYASLNPFKKVPIIDDNDKGFILIESIAILRYFCQAYKVPDQMYPADPVEQAHVDEFLEWHHSNIRHHFTQYFRVKVLWPLKSNKIPDPAKVEAMERQVNESLNLLEDVWLKKNQFFGGNLITIADLVGASELEQTRMGGGFDPFHNRPKLTEWMEKVRAEFTPFYEEAHTIIQEITEEYKLFINGHNQTI